MHCKIVVFSLKFQFLLFWKKITIPSMSVDLCNWQSSRNFMNLCSQTHLVENNFLMLYLLFNGLNGLTPACTFVSIHVHFLRNHDNIFVDNIIITNSLLMIWLKIDKPFNSFCSFMPLHRYWIYWSFFIWHVWDSDLTTGILASSGSKSMHFHLILHHCFFTFFFHVVIPYSNFKLIKL